MYPSYLKTMFYLSQSLNAMMCLYSRIPKAFPYANIWIKFISELNWREKTIKNFWPQTWFIFLHKYSVTIYLYASHFCLWSNLVPWRWNQPNFWCTWTYWMRTQWVSNRVMFCPSAAVLKFLRWIFCSSKFCKWIFLLIW